LQVSRMSVAPKHTQWHSHTRQDSSRGVISPSQRTLPENTHHLQETDINVICFLLGNSPASEFCMPTFRNTLFHLRTRIGMKDPSSFIPIHLWRWNRQGVPKRRHIKFRRRGITQKKA
jgi:hypothetical protein